MIWDSLWMHARVLFRLSISLRFFLFFLFWSVANNFLEWTVRCGERSVSYTLLRDKYEWRCRERWWIVDASLVLRTRICIFVWKFNHRNTGRVLVSSRATGRMRNRARPSRVSWSTNNGSWTREEGRVGVNYFARVITVANKSFITLLLCAWIRDGESARNEINLSRSIARYTGWCASGLSR